MGGKGVLNLQRAFCYRYNYELLLSPRSVFIAPASQRECASNAPHVCCPSVCVFLFALKWLHVPLHKSDYQVTCGERVNIVRVGGRVGVVEGSADVASSFIRIALMLDCNDPIVEGLNVPVVRIEFVSSSRPAASAEKPHDDNGENDDLHDTNRTEASKFTPT